MVTGSVVTLSLNDAEIGEEERRASGHLPTEVTAELARHGGISSLSSLRVLTVLEYN